MKLAWLYCTFDFTLPDEDEHEAWYLGEVTDEGSLRDLIQSHCATYDDDHANFVHLVVEGTPEYDELSTDVGFPYSLPEGWRPREVVR